MNWKTAHSFAKIFSTVTCADGAFFLVGRWTPARDLSELSVYRAVACEGGLGVGRLLRKKSIRLRPAVAGLRRTSEHENEHDGTISNYRGRSHWDHRFESRTFARVLARCPGFRVFSYSASKR